MFLCVPPSRLSFPLKVNIMSRVSAYIKIIRPINCIMIDFAIIIGEIISVGLALPILPSLFGLITGFAITASSMVLNDYVDLPVDRVNTPTRPLPSGEISTRVALIYYALLSGVGVVSSYFINIFTFLVAFGYWILASLYDLKLKRTGLIGNLIVSASVGIPFVFGSLIVSIEVPILALIFFAVAFLANTGREIIKGIVDVEGDKIKNYKTIAVRYGKNAASKMGALFILSAVALSFIPYLLTLAGYTYLLVVGISDIFFLYLAIKILSAPTKEVAYAVKNKILVAMLIALFAFTLIPFTP